MKPFTRSRWVVRAASHISFALLAAAGCQAEPVGTNPLTAARSDDSHFEAVVVEVHRAGPYAYHALRKSDGAESWLVTLGSGQSVGTRVAAQSYASRVDFRSRRLNRTFETMLFGSLAPSQ